MALLSIKVTLGQSVDPGQFIRQRIRPGVVEGVGVVGESVLNEAQTTVPVRTGQLRDSGKVNMLETEHSATAVVAFTAPYSVYVEMGSGIRGASSAGAGPGPYSSTHPGQAAQPFLRSSLDVVRQSALSTIAGKMAEELGT